QPGNWRESGVAARDGRIGRAFSDSNHPRFVLAVPRNDRPSNIAPVPRNPIPLPSEQVVPAADQSIDRNREAPALACRHPQMRITNEEWQMENGKRKMANVIGPFSFYHFPFAMMLWTR